MALPSFPFDQVAAPFRMQPGLRRLEAAATHLTPLTEGSGLWHEKKALLAAGGVRIALPGFDEAPVIAAIGERARAEGHALRDPLELSFEEDFAVLDGRDATLPWLAVGVPSHWAPEDKLGLQFAAVHAPVADNATLQAAGRHLVQLATGGDRWERFVWTLTPSGRHDQHPRRHARTPWPNAADPAALAASTWLRWERQTFFPFIDGTPRAVFTIRVMLQPLAEAVTSPDRAARLHGALSSMTDAVLAYKGLAAARAPLLAWLHARMG